MAGDNLGAVVGLLAIKVLKLSLERRSNLVIEKSELPVAESGAEVNFKAS